MEMFMRWILKILLTSYAVILVNVKCYELAERKNVTGLERINGTNNFRIYSKKRSDDKPWFDSRGDFRHIHCTRPAKCEKLLFHNCLGSKIPYTYTSLDLTDSYNQEHVQERLQSYQALKHVPRCWAVVQPFLCAVFTPKCEKVNGLDMVYLPSLEMCKITLEPCRILFNTTYFPEFLKCNETLFPSKCNNDVREMKFNGTGKCIEPLVATESSSSFYSGIEGCGVQCVDPLYTDDEHRQIHKLVAWGATLCLFFNAFVVATFFIDWRNANKYPAVIVFYVNLCFAVSCLGWLAQFTPGSREDIVCRKDGTLRHSEPSAGENLSCIIVFVFVYYFMTAAMVWFVFLTYAWNLQAVGKDRIDKKGSYFHLVAWSLPLVLTITIMALSEVDGNSTVGICFVGYKHHALRAALLIGPLCGVISIGGCFIVLGTIKLVERKTYLNNINSNSASNKIHVIIVRMGICAIFIFVFMSVAITCHLHEFHNSFKWAESFRKYIICKISATYSDGHLRCNIENRPSVAILQLHLLCLFGSGIVMSSWCWTPSSIDSWRRYIKKKFGQAIIEEVKMQKHRVIAQTWAKRKEFEDKGRLSITFYNTFTDPVGLNFDVNDLNSSATNEISSTWANYLPQFVKRRFALTGAATTNSSSHGLRKSSLDSEFSFSVRHVSVESRRNSIDSQVSVKIAEMKTKVAGRSRASAKHSRMRNRRRDFFTAAKKSRRESSTSVESQVIAMKKFPRTKHNVGVFTHSKSTNNLKRRSASAGLPEPEDITNFISKNGSIFFPFLQNKGLTTTSDEETSRTSFKIKDSQFNVVLKPHENIDKNVLKYEMGDCHTDDESFKKQCKLNDILQHLQTSSSFENVVGRENKDNFEFNVCPNSKSSFKSQTSCQSIRQSIRRINRKNAQINRSKKFSKHADNPSGSFTSYSSEIEIPIEVHSSCSGISVAKTQSRNSKISCDVGIQTNSCELKQTVCSCDHGRKCDQTKYDQTKRELTLLKCHCHSNKFENLAHASSENDTSDSDEEIKATESQKLLPMKPKECILNTSDNEKRKLQMLLLPSKLKIAE